MNNNSLSVLVIGNGGREHAIVWKLKQSPRVKRVYCCPGNAGIAQEAHVLCTPLADNYDALIAKVKDLNIDYTFVGPEAPLANGIVDAFKAAGLRIFGPCKAAAQIEGSKSFSKEIMAAAGVPTAESQSFDQVEPAIEYAKMLGFPVVIKADGLAAGKGVVIAKSLLEASEAIRANLEQKVFGESSNKVLVEEFLVGEEVSLLAFTDGKTVLPMATAQDHKALHDGDLGPNTGGMGAYSPAPILPENKVEQAYTLTLKPIIDEFSKRGICYQGVLYAGLMITKNGIKVLEYNCRFGDPETQPILMRLETDLMDIIEAVCSGTLDSISLQWRPQPAICVVMVASGYPENPQKGAVIYGIDEANNDHTKVFHAGTKLNKDKQIITNGGRVLGITSWGDVLPLAIAQAYEGVNKIHWDGAQFRTDIGQKALRNN
ncbi:MAG: phosphoribosylamine--glycine ligase [Candidatus Sumerlaeales bacterium]|nr:phosphoribosylamine--glycine ligase [Candidatus Sumerlaeales bacterium]